MRQFITKTVFFSLPILFLAIAMELLLRNIPNDYEQKKAYLDKHAAEIETLVMGSSHTYYGVDPVFFTSKAFNVSHVSQTLKYDYAILKKYQPEFKSLRTIVLPLSYFTLYGNIEEGAESWRVKNYNLYYHLNVSGKLKDNSEIFSNTFKVNKKRLTTYYVAHESSITTTELGWCLKREVKKDNDFVEAGKAAELRHTAKEADTALVNYNIAILKSISKWCTEQNIKLVLITMPAYKTYSERLNQDQLNLTINTAQRIANENGNGIYLNFLNDPRFVEADFYDADHLSDIGAEKFSKILNDEINK